MYPLFFGKETAVRVQRQGCVPVASHGNEDNITQNGTLWNLHFRSFFTFESCVGK